MKSQKLIAAALSALLLTSSCILPAHAADPLRGDLNLDGAIDVKDAVLCAQIIGQDDYMPRSISDEQLYAADCNGSGNLEVDDLTALLQYIACLRDTLGAESEKAYSAVNLSAGIQTGQPETKAPDAAFRSSQLKLTADLLKAADAENTQHDNLMISPTSIGLALSMTANGAKGNTLAEMEQVLGNGLSVTDLNQYYAGMVGGLNNTANTSLSVADSVWIRDNENMISVPETFLQTAADYYGAAAFRAAFDTSTENDINNWVDFNTHHMIKSILNPGDLTPDSLMVLINTLAFEGEWATPYMDYQVHDKPFTAFNGDTHDVPMMYSEEHTYLSTEKAAGFLKYYKDYGYAFAAVLPNEDIGIADYVANLDETELTNLMENQEHCTVDAVMPKFDFDYKITLNEALKSLGMEQAFTDEADFTGLNEIAEMQTHIGKVLHKTHITVNEKGTRAAAVTAVMMESGAMMDPPEPKKVTLDRPFLFMIYDLNSNLPVFIGTVNDITE